MEQIHYRTRKIVCLGLMLAVISMLSWLEHCLPPLPMLPAGVKLGLSNIVTMYVLFFLGRREAVLLAFLKSSFVLLTRGVVAGFISLCGGMLSIVTLIVIIALSGDRFSYLILSVIGAISHNLGQIGGASLVLKTSLVFYYLPILIVSGVVMGCVTGSLLRVVMPLFQKLLPKNKVTL